MRPQDLITPAASALKTLEPDVYLELGGAVARAAYYEGGDLGALYVKELGALALAAAVLDVFEEVERDRRRLDRELFREAYS